MSGTPKTLRECIRREMCIGPGLTFEDRMHAAVKDYLSQHFTAALMRDRTREEQRVLTELWESIFKD